MYGDKKHKNYKTAPAPGTLTSVPSLIGKSINRTFNQCIFTHPVVRLFWLWRGETHYIAFMVRLALLPSLHRSDEACALRKNGPTITITTSGWRAVFCCCCVYFSLISTPLENPLLTRDFLPLFSTSPNVVPTVTGPILTPQANFEPNLLKIHSSIV